MRLIESAHGHQAPEPIAVTGIGAVLPGGGGATGFWRNISAGASQIGKLTRFDPDRERLPVFAAAQIDDFDHRPYLPELKPSHAAKYTREILIAMAAAEQARQDAALLPGAVDPRRLSIVMSSSRGPLDWWRTAMEPGAQTPFADSGAMFRGLAGSPASMSAIYIGAQGLVTTISNACVGGHHAIGLALRELRCGASDAVLVGGHEFPILAQVARCYLALGDGVISGERDDPARAVRPYSKDREGFALGEGAVVLCLERESSAYARGAHVYANILAHRALNEADHPTTMDMTGSLTAGLIRDVLDDAGRKPDEVGYVCGHGTATRYNDLAESRALRALYPQRSADALPPHGSNKPIYGHTFGMAGIINAAATSLMLHHQTLAPTANLVEPDPECDHDHVAEGARKAQFDLAVSMSFAFGSQTSVLALEAAR
ncbi:MAG TPA: beta-ketoacyl-[acyl-carrier-protein] synthase family protein [Actinocrinis sp.]|uniref:beta-ketoacyl-[acyl-carrier-protein] synthase family protein n=1 Tax=Actinocrinis sp. TaxID=1920516 RepID=UPI002DDDB8B5|nr:beta-ketoacyl-[acyl-carrier-protein] synthase family protein [Actinocrinis sp.]HEV3170475.1 beta-ketoacyl-[acyl-carrier-protein] synthase family protein [Actinocrinis sp.]